MPANGERGLYTQIIELFLSRRTLPPGPFLKGHSRGSGQRDALQWALRRASNEVAVNRHLTATPSHTASFAAPVG